MGFKATYKVIVNGDKVEKSYDDICRDLGINPESQFVLVTRSGTISHYVGTLSEISGLLDACRRAGY